MKRFVRFLVDFSLPFLAGAVLSAVLFLTLVKCAGGINAG
jgi:hypothetical protein